MIRDLKKSDISGLNNLPPNNWNFDYEAFLNDYIGEYYFHAFVMVHNDKIIGTGNVFFKNKIGWLANIIIAESYRGQGLGYKMTKFLVDYLNDKGCETQLLIATKLGEPVYKKIGFEKMIDYQCFDTELGIDYNNTNSIRNLTDLDLEKLYKLDAEANGEDRSHLIDKFYKTGLGYFCDNELLGFYLPDFGRGLVLARDKQAGIELLKLKHAKEDKRTLLPVDNKEGINFFEKNGFKKGYKCSRMILGMKYKWNPQYIYSYGSGYCG